MLQKSFWLKLPRPFFALAPLANVTDAAFRRVIAKYSKPGGPHAMFTEFVSADGLAFADEEGRGKLMRDLSFTDAERPVVAQFFTGQPETMEGAAQLAAQLGFDGVDINMGCPDKAVERQGAGAALIKDPLRAMSLIEAAKRGAGSLPVSVKTRLGYNRDALEEWLPALLSARPAALTIHARTRKEMSKVPARLERVARAVKIRDEMQRALAPDERTLIVGNGDVKDLNDAREKATAFRLDGVMLGRAIFGRPWLFDETAHPKLEERLRVSIEHAKLFEELLGDLKNFAVMKKHFKAYSEGFDGAKELRMKLMDTKSVVEIESIIEDFLGNRPASAAEIAPRSKAAL